MKKIKTFIPLIVLSLFLSMQSGDINAQSHSVKPDASIRIEQVRKQNAQTAEIFFYERAKDDSRLLQRKYLSDVSE